MVEEVHSRDIALQDTCVVGLEMRGIMLGFALADRLGVPFVPLRKPGKLPGRCLKQSFSKEYGEDAFELQQEYSSAIGSSAIVIDDVLATGGSMMAAVSLLRQLGKDIALVMVSLQVKELNQQWRNKLKGIDVSVCLEI